MFCFPHIWSCSEWRKSFGFQSKLVNCSPPPFLAHLLQKLRKFETLANLPPPLSMLCQGTRLSLLTWGHVNIGWGLPPCFPGPVPSPSSGRIFCSPRGAPVGHASRSVIRGLFTDWLQSSLLLLTVWTTCSYHSLLLLHTWLIFANVLLVHTFLHSLMLCGSCVKGCHKSERERERDCPLFGDWGCKSPQAKSTHPSEFSHLPFSREALCQCGNSGV